MADDNTTGVNPYNLPAFDDNNEGSLLPGWELVNGEPEYFGVQAKTQDTGQSALKSQVENARYGNPASKQMNSGPQQSDWRLRLSLAPGATYLYKQQDPGILAPLVGTAGVIFPYTPNISTSYKANYSAYDLTHSNYKGYFYQSSSVDQISIRTMFTAQNFQEANYLLAVIHFFRSATKMFYGSRDPNAGSPPPILYLNGLGQYQFNNHPVLLSNFEYSLPADVDYIRTTLPADNINRQQQRNRSTSVYSAQFAGLTRLASTLNIFGKSVNQGATTRNNNPGNVKNPRNVATYVPTKIDISLSLLPVQSREQVSKQFNLQQFANGSLVTKGFW